MNNRNLTIGLTHDNHILISGFAVHLGEMVEPYKTSH